MNRWKAAALHLAISALVIGSIIGLVLWLWYPPAMLRMSGLSDLIALIAVVDIVAGPLLTLVVYKRGKPNLRFDLAVIAIVQVGLLTYGLHTLAQVRPVFLVGVIDRFEIVTATEIFPEDLAQADAPFDRLPWGAPMRVGAQLPVDAALRANILDRALAGSDVHLLPRYYVPFDQVRGSLLDRSVPVETLLKSVTPQELQRLKAAGGNDLAGLRYVPLHGIRGTALMLLDPVNGDPIAPVDVNPWDRRTN